MQRANAQAGTAEIWRAIANAPLSNVTVTSTPSQGGFDQSLTASPSSTQGRLAKQSAPSGAASIALTTTKPSALAFGVASDWDNAIARTLRLSVASDAI